jgi:hypothetical protein
LSPAPRAARIPPRPATLVAALALALAAPHAAPHAAPAPAAPATSAAAPRDTARIERFSGWLRRGERFERGVLGDLRFRLEPEFDSRVNGASGWSIHLFAADTLEDFAGIATPPYHGVNATQIEAWHFRNADNSGPNLGDVNAPQERRIFSFVTNPRDYATFRSALEVALWPGRRPESAVDSAMAVMDSIPAGEGRLVIREMKLGNLGAGLTPWFESMRFDVELKPPPAARGR